MKRALLLTYVLSLCTAGFAWGCIEELEANGWVLPAGVEASHVQRILDKYPLVNARSALRDPVKQMQQMLDMLSLKQRRIFMLRYNLDRLEKDLPVRTYGEIAKMLRVSTTLVGRTVSLTLRRLRAPLIDVEASDPRDLPIRLLAVRVELRSKLVDLLNIRSLGQLAGCTEETLLETPGFAAGRINAIKAALLPWGLQLSKKLSMEEILELPVSERLDLSIHQIGLGAEARKVLSGLRIHTVGQILTQLKPGSWRRMRGRIAPASIILTEIDGRIEEIGVRYP